MEKITVVITCYQKFDRFNEILMAWVNQKTVSEVIVVDNSGKFEIDAQSVGHDIKVVSLSENMGTQVKYPIALLAKNKWVIYADDDILPRFGLAKDLYKYKKYGFVGIIGRIFNGSSYYSSTGVRSQNIDQLTRVDWLGGGCTLVHRKHGAVEVANCPANEVDDWWWENWWKPKMFVIPTDKYEFLDPHGGIHATEKCKKWREKYYTQTQSNTKI